jgi:DNA-binding NarL/FixJ family response regulator
MNSKQRIFIVEITPTEAGLRALLTQDPDIEIVGEADNGRGDPCQRLSPTWS